VRLGSQPRWDAGLRLLENVTPAAGSGKLGQGGLAPGHEAATFGAVALVLALALAIAAPLALAACDRPPPAQSLREWTPADHHSSDDDRAAAARPQPQQRAKAAPRAGAPGAGAKDGSDPAEATELAAITWRQQCSACHGASGKGDGQMGAMLRVPDLTLESWQSQVTDAEIAAVIRNGKGKMPNFDVPDAVVRSLVARVRAARGR